MPIWTTTSLPKAVQFAAWRDKLSYPPYSASIRQTSVNHFPVTIRERVLGGVHMNESNYEPCSGIRDAGSAEPYFGVLVLLAGSEISRQGGQETVLCPGNIGLMDSTRSGEFNNPKPVHKFTLHIPFNRMGIALRDGQDFFLKPLDAANDVGALAFNHLRTLSQHFMSIDERDGIQVTEMTIHVLAASFAASRDRTFQSHQLSLLRDIKAFIERNLDDPELTPQQIADRHGISLRYLHLLFAKEAQGVSRWVRRRRLEQCRTDLQCCGGSTKILEIALRWGFNDLSSFNHSFKKQYGVSPRDCQWLNRLRKNSPR